MDGSAIREGTIRNGEWDGEVREYNGDRLTRSVVYKNGVQTGSSKEYRFDGTLAVERVPGEDGQSVTEIHYDASGKTENYRLVRGKRGVVLFDSRNQPQEQKPETGAEGEGDLAGLAGNTAMSVTIREQYDPNGWGDLGRKVNVVGDGKPFYKRPAPKGKRKTQIKDIKEEVMRLAFENVSEQPNVVMKKLDGDKNDRFFLAIDGVLHQIAKGRLFHSANSADEATIDAVTRIGDLFNASVEVPGDFGDMHYRVAAMRLDDSYFVLFTERDLGGEMEVRDVQILKSVSAKKAGAPTQVVTPRELPANAISIANLKEAWESIFLSGMEQHLKQKEAKPGNTAMSVGGFGLNANARAEMEKVRKQYEGTDKWMKAPNGKPTKLTRRLWLLVRTPAFKRWFGDWKNDPANPSVADRDTMRAFLAETFGLEPDAIPMGWTSMFDELAKAMEELTKGIRGYLDWSGPAPTLDLARPTAAGMSMEDASHLTEMMRTPAQPREEAQPEPTPEPAPPEPTPEPAPEPTPEQPVEQEPPAQPKSEWEERNDLDADLEEPFDPDETEGAWRRRESGAPGMENANGEVAYDWKEENGLLVAEEDGETISGGRENFQDEADEALRNITEALPSVEGDVVYLQAGTLEPGKAPTKLVVFGESAQAIAGALDAANVTYRDNFDSIDEKMEEGKETRDGAPYDESHYKVTISGKKNVQAAIQALVGDNGDYGAAVLQDEGGSIRILLNPKSVDMEGVTTLAQASS